MPLKSSLGSPPSDLVTLQNVYTSSYLDCEFVVFIYNITQNCCTDHNGASEHLQERTDSKFWPDQVNSGYPWIIVMLL